MPSTTSSCTKASPAHHRPCHRRGAQRRRLAVSLDLDTSSVEAKQETIVAIDVRPSGRESLVIMRGVCLAARSVIPGIRVVSVMRMVLPFREERLRGSASVGVETSCCRPVSAIA